MTAVKKFKQIPLPDRPREKLLSRGVASLCNRELLSILIGHGTRYKDVFHLAKEIEEMLGNDGSVIKRFDDLSKIKGIGRAKATQIIAAFELARRYLVKEKKIIGSPKDLIPFIEEYFNKKQEHFITVTVDGGSCIIKKRVVFIGTLTQSLIHPREIFAGAITDRANGLFLIHNHPSGNRDPSREDISVTRRLAEVGDIMGIEVIDHLIVGGNAYFSFKENGLL